MPKSYFEMSDKEIAAKAKLTPQEKEAVDRFIAAAKALPKSICIEVDDGWDGEANLKISKRISDGACQQVASLRKKSLSF